MKAGPGSFRPSAVARTRAEWKAGLTARRPSRQTSRRRAELRKWRGGGRSGSARSSPAFVFARASFVDVLPWLPLSVAVGESGIEPVRGSAEPRWCHRRLAVITIMRSWRSSACWKPARRALWAPGLPRGASSPGATAGIARMTPESRLAARLNERPLALSGPLLKPSPSGRTLLRCS